MSYREENAKVGLVLAGVAAVGYGLYQLGLYLYHLLP
jgi:hypothetical protein